MNERHAVYRWDEGMGYRCLCGEEFPMTGMASDHAWRPLWHLSFADWWVDDDGELHMPEVQR